MKVLDKILDDFIILDVAMSTTGIYLGSAFYNSSKCICNIRTQIGKNCFLEAHPNKEI